MSAFSTWKSANEFAVEEMFHVTGATLFLPTMAWGSLAYFAYVLVLLLEVDLSAFSAVPRAKLRVSVSEIVTIDSVHRFLLVIPSSYSTTKLLVLHTYSHCWFIVTPNCASSLRDRVRREETQWGVLALWNVTLSARCSVECIFFYLLVRSSLLKLRPPFSPTCVYTFL